MEALAIRITGIVQGVGFRPFVWRLARQCGLRGQVWNDAEGVLIQAWGTQDALASFQRRLKTETPPLAQVGLVQAVPLRDMESPAEFSIAPSRTGPILTDVSPDAAACAQCLAEIQNPAGRRYRYPFTNCTHCGPRLSIIEAVPYDRANTSMRHFALCPACQAEYDDPGNRRFHAQANACPTCGPAVWLENVRGERLCEAAFIDDIAHAAHLIQEGYIIALKSIGGFHLACNAANAAAVEQLRRRKQRWHKAFALMARDMDVVRRYAQAGTAEEALLRDKAGPIVLLAAHADNPLPGAIAPGQGRLGFMLPYTPLHTLLMQDIATPLVMTSGNRSDEAQCIDNNQARKQLGGIADFFLLHNRDIANRLDDSVARVIKNQPQLLRRARGYASAPLPLPVGFANAPSVLAMGAQLKNTFCLLHKGRAILSPHHGDLEDASVFRAYQDNIDLYQTLYDHRAAVIAVDRHPAYFSSKLGRHQALERGIEMVEVQHHHAHIAACMAEHGLPLHNRPVLGVALDGLGYGDDSELWGGEFLLADYHGFQRLACFQPVAMPGGVRAILEPWRNTLAHLQHSLGWENTAQHYPELLFVRCMRGKPIGNLLTMLARGLNSPPASSAGRLFDAVAALLGLCRDSISYEGQAAILLEAAAESTFAASHPYPFILTEKQGNEPCRLEWGPLWRGMLGELAGGASVESIAGRFHQTVRYAVANTAQFLARQHQVEYMVLSGGLMQNRLLLESLLEDLDGKPCKVLIPRCFPVNDGGIALGQAVVGAAWAINTQS